MRRSFSGPILLLAIGAFSRWRNLHPEAPIFDVLAQYWPFLLIAWGLLRLVEGLIWHREGLRGSFAAGGRAVTGEASPAGASAPSQAGTSGPPAWARRMKRNQTISRGVSAADHAVRSGDRPSGGSGVDLAQGE